MALNFPASPQVGEIFEADNNVIYTWDGNKWTSQYIAPPPVLEAPSVNDVALTDTGVSDDRFTNEVFSVSATIDPEGAPTSSKSVKVRLSENTTTRVITRPTTDVITDVQTVAVSDPVVMHNSSENSWQYIDWAGPPFNRFIAVADGGSNSFKWVWSTDGENWVQFKGPKGASNAYGKNWCYRTADQKIYVGSASQNTVYNTISTLDQLLNYENDGQNWTTSRPHDNTSYRTGMYYDEVNDRICSYRGPWDVSNVFVTKMPFPSSLDDSGWHVCGGISGAHITYPSVIGTAEDGRYYAGGSSPHNEATYPNSWVIYLNQATPSILTFQSTRDDNGYGAEPWFDPVNKRFYQNGWYTNGTNPALNGGSVGNYGNWTILLDPTANSKQLNNGHWNTQLQANIVVGSIKETSESEWTACHWISTDGDTWTRYDTPEAIGIQSYWSYGFDGVAVGKTLLCASSGNIAGKRFGSSSSMGLTIAKPQLTFLTNSGFDQFDVGTPILQSNLLQSGTIVDLDAAARTMIVSDGTWGPANSDITILGPRTDFDEAYCCVMPDGTICDITLEDQGYYQLDGDGPWNITFPAVLNNGDIPDDVIPVDTRLEVFLKATSEYEGFTSESQAISNPITPN